MPLEQVPVQNRFWSKVRKTRQCWLWTAAKRTTATGISYGAIWIGGCRGRHVPAHRVAFLLERGEIADGMMVLHRCDNGLCVRPDHLFLGTHIDNMRDMAQKKRSASANRHGRTTKPHRTARHERNGNAKLTMQKAVEIRAIYHAKKASLSQLASLYCVSKKTILNIVHNRIWV